MEDITQKISAVIHDVTGVSVLESEQDFYDFGVTSVQSLPLLMELEDRFGITIPDDRFIQARTIKALSTMVEELSKV